MPSLFNHILVCGAFMAELLIKLRSHHYVCKVTTPLAREVVESFGKRFVHFKPGRPVNPRFAHLQPPPKRFASANVKIGEYRFHANSLPDFKRHLEMYRVGPNFAQYEELYIPAAVEVDLPVREFKLGTTDKLELREDDQNKQVSAVEYMTAGVPPVTRLIGLQTGKGKGIVSMFSLSRVGLRPLIVVLPRYVEKWCDELVEILDIDRSEIMVIRSGKHLQALTVMAAAGELESKIVVMANTIYRDWIKLYKTIGDDTLDVGYGCLPDEYMATLGAGVRMIDEVHQEFHQCFTLDLYTNCMYSWAMSATLDSKDGFLLKMFDLAYPVNERFKGPAYDKYVNYTAWTYRFSEPDKIRYTERGQTSYSHNVFEQSVIKQPKVLKNYLAMLDMNIQGKYLRNYEEGEKLIIYAASIEMCTIMTEYLKSRYPHLDVRRYVGEDPLENLFEPDIRVSTIGSAGTAYDIPNLTTVIMTTAINSIAANLQAFGRLRKLKSGKTPEAVYWSNADNEKHMVYHEDKVRLLDGRALHLNVVPAPQFV